MSKFRYLGAIAAIILILLIVGPLFVPMDDFKGPIRENFKKLTGRELVIDGDISFSIIPGPRIKASGVKIISLPGATDPNFAEVKSISASLSLLQLIRGKLSFTNIDIYSPVVYVEVLRDGRGTWEVNTSGNNVKPEEKQEIVLPFSSLSIHSGKVSYYRKGKERSLVEGINTEVSVSSLSEKINLKTTFKYNAVPISVRGSIGKLAEIVPVSLELEAFGESVKLTGDFNTVKSIFRGDSEIRGKMEGLIPDLPKELQNKFILSSGIEISGESIKLDKVNLSTGRIKGEGQGKIDFNKKSASLDIAIMPGDVRLKLTSDNFTSPDASKVNINATNIKELLEVLAIDSKYIPDSIENGFAFSSSVSYMDEVVTLKNIGFRAGSANLTGELLIKSKENSRRYEYDLTTDNANALVKLFGVDVPLNISRARISGNVKQEAEKLHLDTIIYSAWSEANVSGFVNLDKSKKTVLKVFMEGDSFARTWGELFKNNMFAGAGTYKIDVDLQGDFNKEINVSTTNSKISIGGDKLVISGVYNLNLTKGASSRADFTISANAIKLEGSKTQQYNKAPGKERWSTEKLDFSWVTNLQGAITFSVKRLVKDNIMVDNLKGKIIASNGALSLDGLSALIEGGILEASGSVSGKDNQSMVFKAKLKNAQLSNLDFSKAYKITQGTIDADINLKSQGKSQFAYIQNLSGNINIDSINGKVSGFNLQKVKAAVVSVNSLDNLLGVLDASFSGGETAYKSLVGKVSIDKGIATIKEFNVDAIDAKAGATGTVNLPDYTMNISANVDVMLKNMPIFGVIIYGPLDNPYHKLDTAALQKYIMQNVLKNALEGGLKSLGSKEGKVRPEDLIKGIIGLGKKK